MKTRQSKREHAHRITEAARAALYHKLLMWDQQSRLEHLLGQEPLVDMGSLMDLASMLDTATEALTVSPGTIRFALGLETSKPAVPESGA